jgi:hypothetical protein
MHCLGGEEGKTKNALFWGKAVKCIVLRKDNRMHCVSGEEGKTKNAFFWGKAMKCIVLRKDNKMHCVGGEQGETKMLCVKAVNCSVLVECCEMYNMNI